MTSFFNFYSDIQNLIEPNEISGNYSVSTPSSFQGGKFNQYQKKIKTNTFKKVNTVTEGFQLLPDLQLDGVGLTRETSDIINSNEPNISSNPRNSVNNLRSIYDNVLNQYETSVQEITGVTTSYLDRISPNNPYLNKVIQFPTGEVSYVTNRGVAKFIPTTDILNSINASSNVAITVPFEKSYKNPGATIPTTPNLITGTPVVSGQSLGNEGKNVYVNTMLTKPTVSYQGCYQDNTGKPLMKFIGGAPLITTSTIFIKNGTFSQPFMTDNFYKDSTDIIGWIGRFYILNNSDAWGYPIPYPYGSQCVSLQATQYIETSYPISFNSATTYTISFYICGRNCCTGGVNQVQVVIGSNIIATVTPTINSWQKVSYNFTSDDGKYVLAFKGTSTSDTSTAIQHVTLSLSTEDEGTYTYDDCKETAIDSGYQYFALQKVSTTSSTGYCAVGNSEPTATQLGTGYIPSKQIALWSSGTQGQTGNTATLDTTGSLSVINTGGASVFSTPPQPNQQTNYLGCYRDCVPNCRSRTMSFANGGSQSYNLNQCQEFAQENNYQYFALQNSTSGTNAQCAVSNSLVDSVRFGVSSNCKQLSDGTYTAGGSTNALYNIVPEGNYFLMLLDDGNMCIYRGTGPTNNQGFIWGTMTNGKQQDPNPAYAAVNGKYGTNWIASGSTLATGDFVGSTTGQLALIMQSDGNLVLYTYQNVLNCQTMNDGNTGGGVGANALYNIGKVGVTSNMSQLAYVDENAETHTYPTTNTQYINSYTTIENNTSSGNAIPNASYGDSTVDDCQLTCNSNSQCAGFVFNTDNNVCTPMDSSMFPKGTKKITNGSDLYIRNKNPLSPPVGVTSDTTNIDTITYQNYVNGGQLESEYGLKQITQSEQTQLETVGDQMNSLVGQMNNSTDTFNKGAIDSSVQTGKNYAGIQNYLTEITDTNNKIKHFNTNVDNILKDTDILVLQENYNYLFWSILATATVLISINVVKK